MDYKAFADESNRIEGLGPASDAEVAALAGFVELLRLTVGDLVGYVRVVQPNAELRSKAGLDVRVGNHHPPPGGPDIVTQLEDLLIRAEVASSYDVHHSYETTHPFTDGNGRSGRALWLWMEKDAPLLFLHAWYYQSLENGR